MFTLSAFADEVSDDLGEQMDVLESEGVRHIELRGVWGKNVLDLTDEEVAKVKEQVGKRSFGISAIGSPIGKIKIGDPFEAHLTRFRRAISVAKTLDAPYIRLFSYFMPEGEDPASHRDEVLRRMGAKVALAEAEGVTCLHENEREIYGDVAPRCLDIHESVPSERLKATFDFANFVIVGQDTLEAWKALKPVVAYFHIKDARADGAICPAGEGDGKLVEILRDAASSGFDGFLSLEPHLAHAGRFTGKTGPDLFRVAVSALRGVVEKAGGKLAE